MKQCLHTTCTNPAFSHGYCQRHQHDRQDDKYLQSVAKQRDNRKGYSSIKPKPKENTGEREMFWAIWSTSNKRSWLTGINLSQFNPSFDDDGNPLYSKLFPSLFHHCLTKKQYPKFRLFEDCVIIVSPQEHLNLHSLSREKLESLYGVDNMDRYFDLIEKLKIEYKNH